MLAPSSGLLRTGLALKVSQIKLATRSYLRDRTDQATGTAASYAVAAGLFAAAGIFVIAASLVGVTALFRWIEIHYGMFPAFGAVAGLLVLIAAICAAIAAGRLRRPPPHFPSLTSRLRVAIKASPLTSGQIEPRPDAAAAADLAPVSEPAFRVHRQRTKTERRAVQTNRNLGAGLILTATLLGWAVARRWQQPARRMDI